MEFPRANCLYHPKELITNFCLQSNCLLPLCPSCVCSHVDFHMKRGGANLKFDNISQTFLNCQASLQNLSQHLQQSLTRAHSLQTSIDRLYAKVGDIIFEARLEVKEIVDRLFEKLEADTMERLRKHCEGNAVHSRARMEEIMAKISEGLKEVNTMVEDLRSEKALPTIIIFNGEKKNFIQRTIAQLEQEFEANCEFDPRVTINTGSFDTISQAITGILEMKFNMKEQNIKQTERSVLVRTNSRQIIESRVFTPIVNKRIIPTQVYENKLIISRMRSPSQTSGVILKSPSVVHHHYVVVNSSPAKNSGTKQNWSSVQTSMENSAVSKKSDKFYTKDRPKSRGLVLHSLQRAESSRNR